MPELYVKTASGFSEVSREDLFSSTGSEPAQVWYKTQDGYELLFQDEAQVPPARTQVVRFEGYEGNTSFATANANDITNFYDPLGASQVKLRAYTTSQGQSGLYVSATQDLYTSLYNGFTQFGGGAYLLRTRPWTGMYFGKDPDNLDYFWNFGHGRNYGSSPDTGHSGPEFDFPSGNTSDVPLFPDMSGSSSDRKARFSDDGTIYAQYTLPKPGSPVLLYDATGTFTTSSPYITNLTVNYSKFGANAITISRPTQSAINWDVSFNKSLINITTLLENNPCMYPDIFNTSSAQNADQPAYYAYNGTVQPSTKTEFITRFTTTHSSNVSGQPNPSDPDTLQNGDVFNFKLYSR